MHLFQMSHEVSQLTTGDCLKCLTIIHLQDAKDTFHGVFDLTVVFSYNLREYYTAV